MTPPARRQYEAVGLLEPTHHTPSGHRRYDAAQADRLLQIVTLRSLGLSLDDIARSDRARNRCGPALRTYVIGFVFGAHTRLVDAAQRWWARHRDKAEVALYVTAGLVVLFFIVDTIVYAVTGRYIF